MSSSSQIAPRSSPEAIQEAEDLWRQGQMRAAFERYRAALQVTLNETGLLTSADMVVLERFSDLAVRLGETGAATEALRAMADLCESAGNLYGKDYAVLKGSLAFYQGGDLGRAVSLFYSLSERFGNIDAIEFLPDALAEWERIVRWPDTDEDDRAVLFALFYLTASRLLAALGQFRNATEAARRGLVHSGGKTAGGKTALARRYRTPLEIAQALSAMERGDFESASTLLRQVESEVNGGRDPGFQMEIVELSAKLAMLRGDLGGALNGLTRSLALARESAVRQAQAASLENLAAFQILINQTARAKDSLDEAAGLLSGAPGDRMNRIQQLRAMADLRARSYADDFSGSVTSKWDGTEGVERVPAAPSAVGVDGDQPVDFLAWFEQRALEFQLALGSRQQRLAAGILTGIREVFQATDSEIVQLRMGFLEALSAYYSGDLARAQGLLRYVLQAFEQAGLLHDLWQARRMSVWIAKRSGAPPEQVKAELSKENQSLNQLAASLDPISRAIFLLNKWSAGEDRIAELAEAAAAMQARAGARFAPVRWWRTWRLWQKTLLLENQLEAEQQALAAVAAGLPASSARRGRILDILRHPAGEARVTFSSLPDRLVAIVRTRRATRIHMLEISRIELRESVRQWHERMLEPGTRARTDALSRSLAAVFEDLPEAVSELRLRPDDALHGFPFAAMPVKGAPAIEKYTISIRQTGAPPEMRKGEPTEAVVLAAGAGEGGYAELPNAVEEVKGTTETLSRLGFRVRAATGAARKSDATDALEKAALVHVVCHGRFQPDQPSQTGLVLAGPDGSAETLSITEIGRMNCKRLEHVTLSACWSADNFVVPGRWIFSLPETFCRAGAGSVLASLWEADDRVAPAFMQRFYRNCATMTRAQALRDSQLACLGNTLCPGVVTSDPVYWANFYLFGESGRLRCN